MTDKLKSLFTEAIFRKMHSLLTAKRMWYFIYMESYTQRGDFKTLKTSILTYQVLGGTHQKNTLAFSHWTPLPRIHAHTVATHTCTHTCRAYVHTHTHALPLARPLSPLVPPHTLCLSLTHTRTCPLRSHPYSCPACLCTQRTHVFVVGAVALRRDRSRVLFVDKVLALAAGPKHKTCPFALTRFVPYTRQHRTHAYSLCTLSHACVQACACRRVVRHSSRQVQDGVGRMMNG